MTINATSVEKFSHDLKNNNIISDFINVCNKVFPAKLEQEYVKLANLFFSFAKESSSLLKSNNDLNKSSDARFRFKKAEAERIRKFYQLLDTLNAINIDEPTTLEELKKIRNNFDDLENSIQTSNKLGKISSESEYDSIRIDAKEAREKLNGLIPQIKNTLENINKLNFNNEKRIDRLSIFPYHLEKIDNIQGLSESKKIILKELLKAYTEMRIGAFKAIEDFVYEVLYSYAKREIIDLYKQSEPLHNKFIVLAHALYTLDESFDNFLESITIQNSPLNDSVNLQFQKNTIKIMSWFADYFNNKELNVDEMENCSMKNDVCYSDKEALIGLLNSQHLQSRNNSISK